MQMPERRATLPLFAIVIGTAMMTGCQTNGVKEMAASGPLSAISRPDRPVGFQSIGLQNGSEEIINKLVAKTAKTESWKQSTGCSWTQPTTGFAPSTRWRGCSGHDGTQSVTLLKGKPFPLKIGSKWTYRIDGENVNVNMWDETRECEVEKAVRIGTRLGEFDTFKIVCDEPWSTRTWYFSPKLGRTLRYIKDHNRRGVTDWELTKTVRPQ